MTDTFPHSAESIDAAWLTRALRDTGAIAAETELAEVRIEDFAGGFGQTGETVRLHLDYSGGAGPKTMIAKFATEDPDRRRASNAIGLYEREIGFYRHWSEKVDIRSPRAYFARHDPASGRFALMLEDFPDHRPGDETVGLTPADGRVAISQVAGLHGPYWGKMGAADLTPLPLAAPEKYEAAFGVMAETFGDLMTPRLHDLRSAYLTAIPHLQDWMNSAPATLIHGDYRLDNLLFGPEGHPDRIVAVDWQAIRPARGMQDVAYLIAHSMNVGDRRAHEIDLLQLYCTELSRYGVDYDLDTAKADYRKTQLYLFCVVLYIVGINVNTHERALRRKRALMTRAITALEDWEALDLLSEVA